MSEAQQADKFQTIYASLIPLAETALKSMEDRLRASLRDYFWPNESFPIITSRVKDRLGFLGKLIENGIDTESPSEILKVKTDLLGIRIVVASREQIERVLEMLRDSSNPWEIQHTAAYTGDAEEREFYEVIGLDDAATKPTGYCGVHFDVLLNDTDGKPRWVEIQIRTKIQDAWQGVDHLIYKAEKWLPDEFLMLRKSLAGQFEAAEKAQRFIFNYVESQVLAKNENLKFTELYKLFDWSKIIGLPKNFRNQIVGCAGLPWYWWIAPDTGMRYSFVIENPKTHPMNQPLTLVTTEHMLEQRPDLMKKVITLPCEFLANIELAGNVELKSFT
jgi:ppGpp synthetase/RelA/SpoT-type nucleotidyltranferase